jgi:hypothetical protein
MNQEPGEHKTLSSDPSTEKSPRGKEPINTGKEEAKMKLFAKN